VAEELLEGTNVDVRSDEVGGETMTEGVGCGRLGDVGEAGGLPIAFWITVGCTWWRLCCGCSAGSG
jgi:hypothetical protein